MTTIVANINPAALTTTTPTHGNSATAGISTAVDLSRFCKPATQKRAGKRRTIERQMERNLRLTKVNIGDPRPTRFKNSPENHERRLQQIRAQQKAHGVEVAVNESAEATCLPDTSDQNQPAESDWLRAAWNRDAAATPAAQQAESIEDVAQNCDVDDGTCEPPAVPAVPHSVAGTRQDAKAAGFTFKVSQSLMKREDQSLKGVVILIADMDHFDRDLRARISAFIGKHIRPEGGRGDKLLVEATTKDPVSHLRVWCHGHEPATASNLQSAACIPIDSAEIAEMVDAHNDLAFDTGIVMLRAMVRHGDKKTDKDSRTRGAIDTTKDILALYRQASQRIQHAVRVEHAAFIEAYNNYVFAQRDSVAPRDENFKAQIETHANPDHATFVPLGALHTSNIMDDIFESYDAIVIAPLKHLVEAPTKYTSVPKEYWDLKRWQAG